MVGIKKVYQVLTNLNCNLNCSYCYENKGRGMNDSESIKCFLSACYERDFGMKREKKEYPDVWIELVGGETLMYPDMLDEICEHVQKLHFRYEIPTQFNVGISTNGTLILQDEAVRKFLRKWAHVISIGFSIDGTQEIHDKCRVDTEGKGSYERAVAGYEWTRSVIPPCRIGAKATYCHETISKYAEGVINLIKLGFREIGANVVYEEVWKKEEAMEIAKQLFKVVNYLVENNLEDKVHIFQLNNPETDIRKYPLMLKAMKGKEQNYCGSCEHMTCIGFDNKIYGCNRFCTMKEPIPMGELKGVVMDITNTALKTEVKEQYKVWPEECKQCPYWAQCPSCAAIPYEVNKEDTSAYYASKPQCGWTHALVAAKMYFGRCLQARDAEEEKSE